MTIYTGRGDKGMTDLFSGARVPKTHPRVEACGTVDELNAVLGCLAAHLTEDHEDLAAEVGRIQGELPHLGARLGTEPGTAMAARLDEREVGITPAHVTALESAIDRLEEALPRLTGFIVPGGHPAAAWAHLARTVCRRAERRVAPVAEEGAQEGEELGAAMAYLNRLSDFLFVAARTCNYTAGVEERVWGR